MVSAPSSGLRQQLSSTVILDILPGVCFFTLVAVAVSTGCHVSGFKMQVNTIMLTIIGVIISFAISLRTSTANDRFNEGRRAWSQISLACRQFAFFVWIYIPVTGLSPAELKSITAQQLEIEKAKTLLEKRTIMNLIHAFAVSTKHYLRNEAGIYYEDLYPLCACLPKYYFPSSAIGPDEDRTEILGLWRTPHKTQLVPTLVSTTTPSAPTLQKVMPTLNRTSPVPPPRHSSLSSGLSTGITQVNSRHEDDIEKGEVKYETIHLRPAHNPPRQTIYDIFPVLSIFKSLFTTRGKRDEENTTQEERRTEVLNEPESNIPLQISLFLQAYFQAVLERGGLLSQPNTIQGPLGSMQEAMVTLERVLTTPLPFAYQAHLRLSVYIYLLFLPFQTYAVLGFLSIVLSFITSLIFLGFMELGSQLEEPFGYDSGDLPLDEYCHLIGKEILEISSHPVPSPASYVFSADNLPFPNDKRSAQEILDETTGPWEIENSPATAPTWRIGKELTRHHSMHQSDRVINRGTESVQILRL